MRRRGNKVVESGLVCVAVFVVVLRRVVVVASETTVVVPVAENHVLGVVALVVRGRVVLAILLMLVRETDTPGHGRPGERPLGRALCRARRGRQH